MCGPQERLFRAGNGAHRRRLPPEPGYPGALRFEHRRRTELGKHRGQRPTAGSRRRTLPLGPITLNFTGTDHGGFDVLGKAHKTAFGQSLDFSVPF
jgi:hypothetical protein